MQQGMYIDGQDPLTAKIAENENSKRFSQRKSKFSSVRQVVNSKDYIQDPDEYEIIQENSQLKELLSLFQVRNLKLMEIIDQIFHRSEGYSIEMYPSQQLQKYQISIDTKEISLQEWNHHYSSLYIEFDTHEKYQLESTVNNNFRILGQTIPEKAKYFRFLGHNEDNKETPIIPLFANKLVTLQSGIWVPLDSYLSEDDFEFEKPRPEWSDAIVLYSKVFKKTFDKSQLAGLREKGFNSIQIDPVLRDAHGNPLHLFAVDGSINELKSFIEEAHNKDLKVFVTLNHHTFSDEKDSFCYGWNKDLIHKSGTHGYTPKYKQFELVSYLLANLIYWEDNFSFDGAIFERSDILIQNELQQSYASVLEYYKEDRVNLDGMVYLILANDSLVNKGKNFKFIKLADNQIKFPHFVGVSQKGYLGFDFEYQSSVKSE